jgi:hypothetical protein
MLCGPQSGKRSRLHGLGDGKEAEDSTALVVDNHNCDWQLSRSTPILIYFSKSSLTGTITSA